ncbi:hypothetical protein LY76DRAFT_583010 [Colletotrichum caudatum]|nr:hypothetical protein LY76DRAFT_583010 [Colletotrichum caudatum]
MAETPAEFQATVLEAPGLLSSVRASLASGSDNAIFTIGGTVKGLAPDSKDAAAPPVTVRWNDSREQAHGRKVAFPVQQAEESQASFVQLVQGCQPATFGRNSQEILDETYRRAGKMDESAFCTSFNPYEHGIIDTVLHSLAPTDKSSAVKRGVRAELYKLNIYSAPSGRFKPHVDTPRSEQQMGSLVVCLPYPHKGGQLAVRHRGQEVVYDWSTNSATQIQWAAFFSDCEHEVREVAEGHRVTLTYNLYWTPYGPTSMADQSLGLEERSLAFYTPLAKLLSCRGFLPEGGRVGFTCAHAYPHSSRAAAKGIHHGLKGIDMLLYQALKRIVGAHAVRVQTALDVTDDDEQDARDPEEETKHRGKSFIADPGSPAQHGEMDYDSGDVRTIGRKAMDVTWLNHKPCRSDNRELAIAYMTYGNEPCLETYYSSVVIIAGLGSFSDDGGRNAFKDDVEDSEEDYEDYEEDYEDYEDDYEDYEEDYEDYEEELEDYDGDLENDNDDEESEY